MAVCDVCFRHCNIEEGGLGFCGARTCKDYHVIAANYGRLTSLALDPIEKKPLNRFHPGNTILSVGSYGCNLRCPFCQNHEISWSEEALRFAERAKFVSPEELCDLAQKTRERGNIGVAFTYNEPLIGYEYIHDTAKLIHEQGMYNILVTNGTAELHVLEHLFPYIDAMNIDLKGFTSHYYNEILGGDFDMVKAFIVESVKHCHVELTTLIVPGENDTIEEICKIADWISQLEDSEGNLIGKSVPLHITRFFPRFNMTDRKATDVGLIYKLADAAGKYLDYVYTGNC